MRISRLFKRRTVAELAAHQDSPNLREISRAIPLRLWLVILMVVISIVGLAASALAVNAIMRQVIFDQVDKDLVAASQGWARDDALLGEDVSHRLPSDYFVMAFRKGETYQLVGIDQPALPDVGSLVLNGRPKTVKSVSNTVGSAGQWRAMATELDDGTVIVVARQIERENQQLKGLTLVQTAILALVILLVAVVGWVATRSALKPLREVEKTAGEIAAGDLDKRVPSWPENTEVGQLSKALNTMLGRLQESVESAQDKEEQMRRFVGDASHELRTPLTSLRGYTELYRSGATNDVDMVFSKIDSESKRMSLLVEDLLSLTRAEGNRLEMRTVDMLELALSVGSTARAAFSGRSIEVRNKAEGIPLVQGDPDRLHQILLNLVSNGLKHGGDDASVTIQLRKENGFVYVDVIDDGKGLSDTDAAHIFERFYRADSSRTRDTGGSGLGLAITKSLVEQHGGTISVRSVEGEGSTFSVALPATQV